MLELLKCLRQSAVKYCFGDGSRIKPRENPASILAHFAFWPNCTLSFYKTRKMLSRSTLSDVEKNVITDILDQAQQDWPEIIEEYIEQTTNAESVSPTYSMSELDLDIDPILRIGRENASISNEIRSYKAVTYDEWLKY